MGIVVRATSGRYNLLDTKEVSQSVHIEHPVLVELCGKPYLNISAEEDEFDDDRQWWSEIVRDACANFAKRWVSSARPAALALAEHCAEDSDLALEFDRACAEYWLKRLEATQETVDRGRKRIYRAFPDLRAAPALPAENGR